MNGLVTRSIVVGVDDSAGSSAAIAWAASTAAAYGCPIILAHAYPDMSHPTTRGFTVPDDELRAEAMKILGLAETHLKELGAATGEPGKQVAAGRPVDVLSDISDGERMLVVGRRGRQGFLGALMGSSAFGVAEHSRVPVVVVPDGWDPASRAKGRVFLGLDGVTTGDAAVEFAFEFASQTGSGLTCVKVCPSIDPYVPVQVYARENERWFGDERRAMAEQIAGCLQNYPDVDVESTVVGGQEVGTLLDLSAEARLVVVGGKPHGRFSGALIGSVARGLLHHSECPVTVVHKAT